MTYPHGIIKNVILYKRCKTAPLSERVARSRWKMLGHILRRDNNTPAQLALFFAVNSMNNMVGRVGRHQSNLLRTIKNDLNNRNIELVNTDDLTELIYIASDRQKWRDLF